MAGVCRAIGTSYRSPSAVIAIVPEYRDYYFAYVEDEYVIVEPDTYEVVAVLPAETSQAGPSSGRQAGSGQCSAQLSLSSKERELILDNVRGGREADCPTSAWVATFPRVSSFNASPRACLLKLRYLEGCQYFDAGDQIAIVDPDEDRSSWSSTRANERAREWAIVHSRANQEGA